MGCIVSFSPPIRPPGIPLPLQVLMTPGCRDRGDCGGRLKIIKPESGIGGGWATLSN